MNTLLSLDHSLLFFINKSFTNNFFDFLFPLITDLHKNQVFIIIVLFFGFSSFFWNKKIFYVFFSLCIVLAINDLIGAQIKDFFIRPRPDLAGLKVSLRSPHAGGGSFPSNHALNIFCLATYITFYFPRLRYFLFSLAFLVAYSRVYCGVHYPSDVISGASLGYMNGLIFSRYIFSRWIKDIK